MTETIEKTNHIPEADPAMANSESRVTESAPTTEDKTLENNSPASETSSEEKLPETQNGTPTEESSAELKKVESRADAFSKGRIVIIMFSLCTALFLAALDVTIITTALPTIASHFHATAADYTWVGSAYLLANAASTPLWGKFSDIWGRKPMLMLANLTFMVGSLIAAVSVTIGMLIGGRVIQGIGGGGLVVLVNICIGDLFSMRDRPKYYGFVGMVWAIASGVGPVIGGAFTEGVSWRWCFYINLPLDGLSLILLIFFLKLDTPKTPFIAGIKAIDWPGVITIVGGVVMFLFGMESGGLTHPWGSAFTLCLIIFGLVLITIFFINEWKFAKYPIMPLRLFNDHSNLAVMGICSCHGMVFIAASYYLPLYFQAVIGATPILSGVYLFALVLSLSGSSAMVGIFIKNTGKYLPAIWFGMTFMALGTGLYIALGRTPNWAEIIIFQIIQGLGIGPIFQAPLIALQSHVKGHDIAVATATYQFVRNLSTSISIIIGGVIFQNELSKKQPMLLRALGPKLASQLAGSSFGSTTSLVRQLPKAQKEVVDQAYTSSLRTMWIFYTAIAVFGIFISFFVTKKELSRQHEKAKTGIEEQERVRVLEKEEQRHRRSVQEARKGEKAVADV